MAMRVHPAVEAIGGRGVSVGADWIAIAQHHEQLIALQAKGDVYPFLLPLAQVRSLEENERWGGARESGRTSWSRKDGLFLPFCVNDQDVYLARTSRVESLLPKHPKRERRNTLVPPWRSYLSPDVVLAHDHLVHLAGTETHQSDTRSVGYCRAHGDHLRPAGVVLAELLEHIRDGLDNYAMPTAHGGIRPNRIAANSAAKRVLPAISANLDKRDILEPPPGDDFPDVVLPPNEKWNLTSWWVAKL